MRFRLLSFLLHAVAIRFLCIVSLNFVSHSTIQFFPLNLISMLLMSATIGYPSHIFIHSIPYLDGLMDVFPFQLRIVQLPIRPLVFLRSLSRFDRSIEDIVYRLFVAGSELAGQSSAHSLSRGNRSNGSSHGHSSGHSTGKRSTSRSCQGRSHNESPDYGRILFRIRYRNCVSSVPRQ